MNKVSYSEAACFTECEQKWVFKYLWDEPEPTKGKALSLGILVHEGVDVLYRTDFAFGAGPAIEAMDFLRRAEDIDDQVMEKATWLIRRYVEVYQDEPFQSYQGEVPFEFQYGNVMLRGRIDGLKRDDQGRLWVVERKTTSSLSQAVDLAYISPQVTLYDLAARKMGLEPYGIEYDVIYTYQWKKERPAEDSFFRVHLDRTYEQRKHATNWLDTVLMRRAEVADRPTKAVKNVSRNCLWCPYRYPCLDPTGTPIELVEE